MRLFVVLAFAIVISSLQAQPLLPEQVEKLEAGLLATPGDSAVRSRLLIYYFSLNLPAAQVIEPRRRHILYLIANQPDIPLLSNVTGRLRKSGDRLADAAGYAEASKLWLQQVSAADAKVSTIVSAAEFLMLEDRDQALKIINDGYRQFPGTPGIGFLKGTIGGLNLLSPSRFDQIGRGAGYSRDALKNEKSLQVQKEMESMEDPNVLSGLVTSIANQFYEFHREDEAAAGQLFLLAESYLARASAKLPGDSRVQTAVNSLYTIAAISKHQPADKVRLLEQAAAIVNLPQPRSTLLATLAEAHFSNQQFDAAVKDAEEALKTVPAAVAGRPSFSNGNVIHESNTILGRVALKRKNTDAAKRYLLASAEVESTPVLGSFGPKWTLAQELLEAGEPEVVIDYIVRCKVFWKNKNQLLDSWVASIRAGNTPEFRRKSLPTASIVGKDAAAFQLTDLSGRLHSLAAYKGKVILLDFWGTWCAPCRKEMPIFEKLHKELQDSYAVILTVNVGEERDLVASYIDKEKFTFPVLLAEHGPMPNLYNVSAYPTLVVIGKDGLVADFLEGSREEDALRAAIERGRKGAAAAPLKKAD